MGFYESDPLNEAPLLEIPSHQYGPLLGMRQNYTQMEPARPFLWSGYGWKGWVVPRAAILLANTPTGLAPYQQVEDRLGVPPGTWILGFSAHTSQNQSTGGFRLSIYDVGVQDYCLSEGFVDDHANLQDSSDTDPALPHMLPCPYYVVAAGQSGMGLLQARLVNSSGVSNDAQVMIHLACPMGQQSPGAQS